MLADNDDETMIFHDCLLIIVGFTYKHSFIMQ